MSDRQQFVHARWDDQQRNVLSALISDELIEEHQRAPLGKHSDALQRVLLYFRRQPTEGKYLAVMTKEWAEYRIGVLSGVRGVRPTILEAESYATENEVLHAIFLRRVRELRSERGSR